MNSRIKKSTAVIAFAAMLNACSSGGGSTGAASDSTGGGTDDGSITTPWDDMPAPTNARTWDVEQITSSLTLIAANVSHGIANQYSDTNDGTTRTIATNGVPTHDIGNHNNQISAQNYVFTMPMNPTQNATATYLGIGAAVGAQFGVTVEGVKFSPVAAEYYERGGATWNYVVLNGAIPLNQDANYGHTNSRGEYHHHGISGDLLTALGYSSSAHSPLVGYAFDGFPIYAYTGAGGSVETSSWRLRSGDRPGEANDAPDGTYDGTFHADYEYIEGSGTLDECNGKMTVSAEYPSGTYAYFLTDEYPTIPMCFRGSVGSSANALRSVIERPVQPGEQTQDAGMLLATSDQMALARDGFESLHDREADDHISLTLGEDEITASLSQGNTWAKVRRVEAVASEATAGGGEGVFTQVMAGQELVDTDQRTLGVAVGLEQGDWTYTSQTDTLKEGVTIAGYGSQAIGEAARASAYVAITSFENEMTATSGETAITSSLRIMAEAQVEGSIELENGIIIQPSMALSVGEEQIEAYTYTDGTAIAEETVGLEAVRVGGKIMLLPSERWGQVTVGAEVEQMQATGDIRLSSTTVLVPEAETSAQVSIDWSYEISDQTILGATVRATETDGEMETEGSLSVSHQRAF